MKQRVLVTGAGGFIGRNLLQHLRDDGVFEVIEIHRSSNPDDLEKGLTACDFVVHLAGTNRPENPAAFVQDNTDFTQMIVESLERHSPKPVIFSSSTQASLDNAYGRSKYAAELILGEYSRKNHVPVRIMRLPNVFRKVGPSSLQLCRSHLYS